jgi:peptidoglycan L-alanyl-D-glutamate endopeptidase CwlK
VDTRSESVLSLVDPALAALVRTAQRFLSPQGITMSVYQGLRTAAQQNALYARGRTAPGKIVTDARGGHSNHNYGLAVDIVPYEAGTMGVLNWDVASAPFQTMVRYLKAQGLTYGGDWKTFPDDDHFQMPTIPASPSPAMIADLSLGLEAVWANAAAGKYTETI